jgi:hypothetical protein
MRASARCAQPSSGRSSTSARKGRLGAAELCGCRAAHGRTAREHRCARGRCGRREREREESMGWPSVISSSARRNSAYKASGVIAVRPGVRCPDVNDGRARRLPGHPGDRFVHFAPAGMLACTPSSMTVSATRFVGVGGTSQGRLGRWGDSPIAVSEGGLELRTAPSGPVRLCPERLLLAGQTAPRADCGPSTSGRIRRGP